MTALVPLTSNPAPSAGTLTETTWSRAWTARQMYHKRILTYFTRIQSFDKRGHNLSPEICNSVFCFNSSRWWHTVWVQELCEQGGGADGFSFPIPFFPGPNKPQRKTQCPTFRCKSLQRNLVHKCLQDTDLRKLVELQMYLLRLLGVSELLLDKIPVWKKSFWWFQPPRLRAVPL